MHEKNFTLAKEYIVLNDIEKLQDLILSGFDIDRESDKEHYSLLDYFLMFSQNFERPKIASLLHYYLRRALLPKEELFLGIMQSNNDILIRLLSSEKVKQKIDLSTISYDKWDNMTPIYIRNFWNNYVSPAHLNFLTAIELLELATRVGNLDLISVCIDQYGQSFNINDYINIRKDSIIHIASGLGYKDTIKLLLDFGSDINLPNKFLWSPIHFATRYGHLEAVKELVNNKADITLKTISNETALDIANNNKKYEIVSVLSR